MPGPRNADCGRRMPVRHNRLGASRPRRKGTPMKEMITAVIGGALLTGAMLGCGAASADAYYKDCTAAWNAGVAPLHEGDDGYETPRLDRDGDGKRVQLRHQQSR